MFKRSSSIEHNLATAGRVVKTLNKKGTFHGFIHWLRGFATGVDSKADAGGPRPVSAARTKKARGHPKTTTGILEPTLGYAALRRLAVALHEDGGDPAPATAAADKQRGNRRDWLADVTFPL